MMSYFVPVFGGFNEKRTSLAAIPARFSAGFRRLLLTGAALVTVACSESIAQSDSLKSLTQQFNRYQQQTLQEKLYLHIDRPLYMSGELMWFKAYAVDGTFHRPLPMSKVAYIEVINENQRPVLQAKIALQNAHGNGSFVLPASLPSGAYTVRAYTSWMKNFGPDQFFHTTIRIINPTVTMGLKTQTDTAAVDAQFFPEGGALVQELPSTVGFKITNRQGRSLAATGKVVDEKGTTVAQFATQRFGMGRFQLTPQPGATYTALIQLPGRRIVAQKLPVAMAQGYVLGLTSDATETLAVTVTSRFPSRTSTSEELLLLAHAGQRVVTSGIIHLQNGTGRLQVDKKLLPDGITHFTVFTAQKQPIAERLYFTRPRQSLRMTASTDKKQYAPREKVALTLRTATETEAAQAADVSVAVYRFDSLSAVAGPAIGSYLWLTSDLRGTIERPEYYLTQTGTEAEAAADNLMLTQGWSRFTWPQVFGGKPTLPFLPEINGHLVEARVIQSGTRQPASGIYAFLAAPSRLTRTYNAVSTAAGLLRFETHDLRGDNTVTLQTSALKDSLYQFEILNPFSAAMSAGGSMAQPGSSADEAALQERSIGVQTQRAYFGKALTRFTPTPIDSLPFFGKPDEHYRLDDYTRFKVMEEVLREYVPGVQVRLRKDGFHFMILDHINNTILQDNPLVLLDGVPVPDLTKLMAFDPLKIKTLDVVTAPYFQGTMQYAGIVSFTTYRGDLNGFQLNPHVLLQEYQGIQENREFYSPRYETPEAAQSRLADLRNLLLWQPQVHTTPAGSAALEFFTSDQPGMYLIEVQGLSATGRAGTARFTFEVKRAL